MFIYLKKTIFFKKKFFKIKLIKKKRKTFKI